MAGIKSIQYRTITIPAGLNTNTTAINNVTVAKTMVLYNGHHQGVQVAWDLRVALANSALVLAQRAYADPEGPSTADVCVVEFN